MIFMLDLYDIHTSVLIYNIYKYNKLFYIVEQWYNVTRDDKFMFY